MAGFSEQFEHFVPPDQETIRDGIVSGLVILDSNVLLSAYRFAAKSRAELLNVLVSLGDRIWIPHQVGLEFHRNRLKVIAEYDAAYKDVIDTLVRHRDEFKPEFEKKIRELSNRVALPDDERDDLIATLASSLEKLEAMLEVLRSSHGVGTPATPDSILAEMGDILEGKIGEPLSAEDESKEKAEAASRIDKKVPPGFRDSAKDEPHGDYFVWCQSLREAQKRQSRILVFVTNDAKEDWYLRLKGQTVMARPELALECSTKTNARLVMLPARLFLSYAKKYLKAEVSDETIRDADKASLADEIELERNRIIVKLARDHFDHVRYSEAELVNKLRDIATQKIETEKTMTYANQALVEAIERRNGYNDRLANKLEVPPGELDEINKLIANFEFQASSASSLLRALDGEWENAKRELNAVRINLASASYNLDSARTHLSY